MSEKFICPVCGKSFTPYKTSLYRFQNGKRKNLYCSPACSNIARRRVVCHCNNCGKEFEKVPKEVKEHNFCSRSCSASFNNKIRTGKRYNTSKSPYCSKSTERNYVSCLNCGKEFLQRNERNVYCSNDCRREYEYNSKIQQWLSGEFDGLTGYQTSRHVKRYMLERADYSCEICGCNDINPYTGKTILEIHHKDGNYRNNTVENLQVLCPNCHAKTENYKARNKNGRKARLKYSL